MTAAGDDGDVRTILPAELSLGQLMKSDYVSATRLAGCQMIEAVNFQFLVSGLAVGLVISERNFHLLTSPYPIFRHRHDVPGGRV